MSGAPTILVAELGSDTLWVRVAARGDLSLSPSVKSLASEAMDRGIARLIFDLEECPTMDSTFMGTLTGITLRGEEKKCEVLVLKVGSRNLELFRQLGLDHVLKIDADGGGHADDCSRVKELLAAHQTDAVSKDDVAATSLEAHETLGEVDSENVERFRDVIEYLRKDLADPQDTGD